MSRFGGLLMGALGNTFTNVANEHRAEDKQIRQEARAMDAYRGKKDIDTEYARAEETRQQEISENRQQQVVQAIDQMPDDVRTSPMKIAEYFARAGMTDYAKDFIGMMKTGAEIDATGALEEQRTAAARKYDRERQEVGAASQRAPAGILEFEYIQSLPPEQQEAYYSHLGNKRPGSADWASTDYKDMRQYEGADPSTQARLWDIAYEKELMNSVRNSVMPADEGTDGRRQAEADARRVVETRYGQRPGSATAPAPATPPADRPPLTGFVR